MVSLAWAQSQELTFLTLKGLISRVRVGELCSSYLGQVQWLSHSCTRGRGVKLKPRVSYNGSKSTKYLELVCTCARVHVCVRVTCASDCVRVHVHSCARVGECLRLELDASLSRSLQKAGSPSECGARTWNMEHGLG